MGAAHLSQRTSSLNAFWPAPVPFIIQANGWTATLPPICGWVERRENDVKRLHVSRPELAVCLMVHGHALVAAPSWRQPPPAYYLPQDRGQRSHLPTL